jgi:hypothetical protein
MIEQLTGIYLTMYEYALRTHEARGVLNQDTHLAERYPKLTMLSMSPKFDKQMAFDIIYAKQLQETNQETTEQTFERTSRLGKKLADTYLYSQNPTLRPTNEQFTVASNRLRERQQEEEHK